MPQKELDRLKAVHRFLNLEIDKDQELNEIAVLAAELCDTPIAIISIEKEIRYSFIKNGVTFAITEAGKLFCERISNSNDVVIVTDALQDDPHTLFRFYAGAPLVTHDGHILGSICIIDPNPRQLQPAQQHLLKMLAKRIIQTLEFDFSLGVLKQQFIEAKSAEIKLRSFFESSSSCHLLIGRELEVMAYNKNMYRFLQRAHQVKLYQGIKVDQILHGAYLEDFIKDYQTALSGTPVKYERFVKYPNGENIWWHATFEPGYGPEGEIIGISYNATDITEFKLYEQRILDQNESLKNIAHIQSHELRKPVATILGFMELFKVNDYNASRDELAMMENAAKELDEKIRSIVDLTENSDQEFNS